MKILINLTGQLTEGDYREPRGAVTALHLEAAPGVHVKVMLGAAGLVFQRGEQKVAIPLPEMFATVGRACPEFVAVSGEKPTTAPTALQREISRMIGENPKTTETAS